MHNDHDVFVAGIHGLKRVSLTFFSKEDSRSLVRSCAPMDYGPSRRAKDESDRHHFWDYDSDTGSHTLGLPPAQIVSMTATAVSFAPAEFVDWSPISWFLARDWGPYS